MVAGAGVSAYSAYSKGQADKKYYNYLADQNRSLAERTRAAAEQEVTGIQDVALKNADELNRQANQLEGRQKAVLAKSGVWGSSRTSQDIMADTATQEGRDAMALRYNADMASWSSRAGAEEKAAAPRGQAQGYNMAGRNSAIAGGWNTASSVLNSASSMADTWNRWKKS